MTGNALEDAPSPDSTRSWPSSRPEVPFLDGYVLSIIGVVMVQITEQWGLSALQQGLIGASSLVGILLGSFAGGWMTDRFGREALFTLDLVAISALSVAQFFVNDVLWLFVLRLLIGIVVGADYPIATSLMAEFAPRKYRGPLLGAFVTAWFVGAAAAYLVGQVLFQVGDDGWRWMLASAVVPGAIIVLARIGTPESPRWLMSRGEIDKANAVLRKVYGPHVSVADLADEEEEEKVGVRAFFKSGYGGRMAFVGAFWTCSVVPLFAVYAFAPAILSALNLDNDAAHVGSALITVLFMVGCAIALLFVNRIGRRPLLIHSFVWSGIALLLLGIFPNSPTTVIMVLFAAYALLTGSSQILQYIYPTELFPTELRGSAVGPGHSLSRIGAAAGTFLVPISVNSLALGPRCSSVLRSLWWAPSSRRSGRRRPGASRSPKAPRSQTGPVPSNPSGRDERRRRDWKIMRFSEVLNVVGCHVGGEVGNVVVGGVGDVPGKTMFEKRLYLEHERDDIRQLLLKEPRGSMIRAANVVLPRPTQTPTWAT